MRLLINLTASLIAVAFASGKPTVTLTDNYNQAQNVIVRKGVSKGGTVRYLGSYPGSGGIQQCENACISSSQRCWYFVYYKDTAPTPGTLEGTYRISVKSDGLQLHADDGGDKLISTRYQPHDDYAAFTLESVGGGAYRIRVVADGRMLHADDEGTFAVETISQGDDDYNHFIFSKNGDGSYSITTKASGRQWVIDDQGSKLVTTAKPGELGSKSASFILTPDASGNAGQCYAITSPGWNPSYDTATTTGTVQWDCRSDEDCSLNGKCQSGTCKCRAAWKGARCETLNTLKPKRGSGYRGVDNGHNTSSWGGAVLKADDGMYHMWAAEMTEHCGIGAWVQNSRIIHATSPSAGGPYTRKDVTWEVFAHEPEVVPGPNGEYVMYFTANPRSEHGWCNCCREGHGPCDGSTGPGDCPGGSPGEGGSYMSHTTDPNGKWSDPVEIFAGYHGGDTNFAPLILANGSFIGMWRHWGGGNGGSRQFLATGSDWKDPSTYVQHKTELFPDLGGAGTEDQFVYQDSDGNFHAYFHHMYGSGTKNQWWLDATGGHAFSRDGFDWTYTGVSWGDAKARYNTPEGQGATIEFADGSKVKFTRVERPHLVFASKEFRGDPIYLTNSAQYGMGTNPGSGAMNDDACYTLVQPVNRDEDTLVV